MRALQILVCLILALGSVAYARGPKIHQFGPTGILGTISKTTIKTAKIGKGSPADGKIKSGDQIIGVGAAKFKKDVRREFADAIDEAETEKAGGKLTILLKGGKKVNLQLKVLGSYSDTAPYNCPKTNAIITQAADYLVASKKYGGPLRIGLLGLLATGEKKYIDVVEKALKDPKSKCLNPNVDDLNAVIRGDKDMGYVGWYWGYLCITLGEYHLMTGDKSVLPALKAYSNTLARGQDPGGMWGHRMATDKRNRRLPGYAQMNQPTLTSYMGLLMAKKCGVKDPSVEKAIKKCHDLYSTFIGRGAFNYGVHGPNTRTFNNNGTSATGALTMALIGNSKGATFFSRLSATSYDGLETGHTGHFFNVMWTPLGANVSGPEVTQKFFKKSRWLQTLYRSWDGSFTFDGDHYRTTNSTGAHLLTYCLGRQKLYITGKDADRTIWLKDPQATEVVETCNIDYKAKNADQLIAMFGHPLPQVRRRAIWTLREKDGDFIGKVAEMAKRGTKFQRLSAIGYFGYKCPKEVAMARMDDLGTILRDPKEDPEIRATAASSLSFLGESAYKFYPDMLKLVVAEKSGNTFGDIDWSLARSIETLCKEPFKAGLVKDRKLFYRAALKLADAKRQQVRGYGLRMLAGVPLEDFHIVADKVLHVIKDQDPTYHSYHSPGGPVGAGITILANLNVKEGIQYALNVLDMESGKWGFKVRMIAAVLPKYGGNAKEALKKLKSDKRFNNIEKGRFGGMWKKMIKTIEEDKSPPKLITFQEAKQAGH